MESIHFFTEDITFALPVPEVTQRWLTHIITDHNQTVSNINFIFCSDNYLLNINRTYLEHDYYTDIITFDNREAQNDPIESDIFISVDRVEDNAKTLGTEFFRELHRVMAHGVLHLLGYNDKADAEQSVMREKEEACLSLHPDYQ